MCIYICIYIYEYGVHTERLLVHPAIMHVYTETDTATDTATETDVDTDADTRKHTQTHKYVCMYTHIDIYSHRHTGTHINLYIC